MAAAKTEFTTEYKISGCQGMNILLAVNVGAREMAGLDCDCILIES